MKSWQASSFALLSILLGGCDTESSAPVAARDYADPGVILGSGHEMRYGILPMAEIPASVRKSYGLGGHADGLLVNVSVLQRNAAGQIGSSVESVVSGTLRRLTGQDTTLEFRAVHTGEVVSYLALAPLHDREPVTFLLQARPLQSPASMSAKVVRQFEHSRQ